MPNPNRVGILDAWLLRLNTKRQQQLSGETKKWNVTLGVTVVDNVEAEVYVLAGNMAEAVHIALRDVVSGALQPKWKFNPEPDVDMTSLTALHIDLVETP